MKASGAGAGYLNALRSLRHDFQGEHAIRKRDWVKRVEINPLRLTISAEERRGRTGSSLELG